jgi:hypothetical protein
MKFSITDMLDERVCRNILYVIVAHGLEIMSWMFFAKGVVILTSTVMSRWMDCYGVQMDGIIESHEVDSHDNQNLGYFILLQYLGTSLEGKVVHNPTLKGTTITNKDNTIMHFCKVSKTVYEDAVKTGHIMIMVDPRYPKNWIPLEDYTTLYVTPLKSCAGVFLVAGWVFLKQLSFSIWTFVPGGFHFSIGCIPSLCVMAFMMFMIGFWPLFKLLSSLAPIFLKEPLCGPSMNAEIGFKTNLFFKLLVVLLSPILFVCWIQRKWKGCNTQTFAQPVDVAVGNGTSLMSVTGMSNETTTNISIL